MTRDQEFETIVAGFVDGVRVLVPSWYRDRRGREIPTPAFHYEIEDVVLAANDDGDPLHKFLGLRAPRRHAKTTLISKAFNLWTGLNSACIEKMDEYVVLGSASQRQSLNWLRAIVNNLLDNKKVQSYFGKVQKGRYWRIGEGDVELKFPGGRHVRYRAAGAGMEWRGDQDENVRPTTVTLDDITKDDESKTEQGRASRVDWVLATVIPAIDTDGRIINVGTPRPYTDDWNSGIIESLASDDVPEDERWELRTWQAVPDLNDPSMPVLWPERNSREYLLGLLEQWKRIGREWLWWSEFQCKVVSASGKPFPAEWYADGRWSGRLVKTNAGPFLQVDGLGRIPLNVYIGVDSGFSNARRADLTVISAWGLDPNRGWWQIEEHAERGMHTPDALRTALLMGARNQARSITFERVGAQAALEQFCNEEQDRMRKAGTLLHYMEIKDYPPGNRQSKEDRIKTAFQTPYSHGLVHHRKGKCHGIENELGNFPAIHPDRLDSAYYAFVEAEPAAHAAPSDSPALVTLEPSACFDFLTGAELTNGDRKLHRSRTT